MGKVVDGVELLRMIRDGEIKINKTKIIDTSTKEEYIFDDNNIRNKHFDNLLDQVCDIEFIRKNFEILSEEDEEINIDDIKELDTIRTYQNYELAIKINELIKAIKQLDKKIKEK